MRGSRRTCTYNLNVIEFNMVVEVGMIVEVKQVKTTSEEIFWNSGTAE
jgi:hypothetical protein